MASDPVQPCEDATRQDSMTAAPPWDTEMLYITGLEAAGNKRTTQRRAKFIAGGPGGALGY
jgi:hypothetical protein